MIWLDGRVALVTGAAQGIGAAIATRLHEAGATVYLMDIQAHKGEALASGLGARARYLHGDLADDEAIEDCLDTVVRHSGHLDILVNCACLYADRGLDATREEWNAALNVNLVGAAILTSKAAKRMSVTGAVIVNIGSIGGKFGAAGRALYPASKAALMQFTRNAAATLAPRGIRVLTVSPAWTWSPALEAMAGTQERADTVGGRLHPLGRVGRPRDVADVVLLACSDLAGFMTGTDLAADGGFSMLGPDQGRSPRNWFEDDHT